jgi:hypothetical protein
MARLQIKLHHWATRAAMLALFLGVVLTLSWVAFLGWMAVRAFSPM